MSLELFGRRATPGNHVGELPECEAAQAELRRFHALGHNTITVTDYEKLIHAGIEPDNFLSVSPEEFRNLAAPAVQARESLV